MTEFDIPIFKKAYDLYKKLNELRNLVPKNSRFTVFERCENAALDIIEGILYASGQRKQGKLPVLERVSAKLNLVRVLVRLMKDVKAIDNKKYIALQEAIDEIGKMLGGWIRSLTTSV